MALRMRAETLKLLHQEVREGRLPKGALEELIAKGSADIEVRDQPYYSKFFLGSTRTGAASPYTFTVAEGTRRAFDYGIGENVSSGGDGDLTTYAATEVDTNLVDGKRTNKGASFRVEGISLVQDPLSDPLIASYLAAEAHVEIQIDNDTVWKCPLAFIPGFTPKGGSLLLEPGYLELTPTPYEPPILDTGPYAGQKLALLKEPLIWKPNGERDGALKILIVVADDIAITVTERTATNSIAGDDATAETAFAAPAAGAVGSYYAGWFVLHGRERSVRSQNA